MQIIDRNGTVVIKLTQSEGRRMRDAAYLATRAAVNLSDAEKSEALKKAAELILEFANRNTPVMAQEKLNLQDEEPPNGE